MSDAIAADIQVAEDACVWQAVSPGEWQVIAAHASRAVNAD